MTHYLWETYDGKTWTCISKNKFQVYLNEARTQYMSRYEQEAHGDPGYALACTNVADGFAQEGDTQPDCALIRRFSVWDQPLRDKMNGLAQQTIKSPLRQTERVYLWESYDDGHYWTCICDSPYPSTAHRKMYGSQKKWTAAWDKPWYKAYALALTSFDDDSAFEHEVRQGNDMKPFLILITFEHSEPSCNKAP